MTAEPGGVRARVAQRQQPPASRPRARVEPGQDPAQPEGTASLIAGKRRLIDDLDARIIALIGERMAVSGEIQAARLGSGGRRLHLNREMEVLRTYGEALGRPGTSVAMTLLELCRGRV
ncbi:chorismate mutase [Actinacidiphila sp. ITFR-21]|uniref:chorismate mutase n=1 Tax=Actinacidiphila sp. ITFR-21 TaxID=3075199 RepID=UPI003D80ABD9